MPDRDCVVLEMTGHRTWTEVKREMDANDAINWQQEASRAQDRVNKVCRSQVQMLRALRNICKATAPGAWEELFRVTLTNARQQIADERQAK